MLNDKFFLDVASRLAEESHCVSLHVGAVIVNDKRIISMGYNGTPSGARNCDEMMAEGFFTKETHHEWSLINEIHAEMNALMFAAKRGISVEGCTMYVTHQPCNDCLKNIYQSGIKRVVYIHPYSRCANDSVIHGLDIEIERYDEEAVKATESIKNKLYELQTAYSANMRCGNGVVCQRLSQQIDEILNVLKADFDDEALQL